MASSPVRVGIIGTGNIANGHIAALRAQHDRVEVVAAVDVDADRVAAFCRTHAIPRSYTSPEQMLATEQPTLVHICTPPSVHAALSILCLDAGAWVLCEKPLCGSLAELDGIAEAEQRTGRFSSSVFQWRFGSMAQHLKRLMVEGALGRHLLGLCQTTWYRGPAYYQVPWRGKWSNELGGVTMGQGIHVMDLFLWLFGDWREVSAMIGTLDRAMEVEDVSLALVRFESGAHGSVVNSVLSPHEETVLHLEFQAATVELRSLYSYTNQHWQFTAAPDVPAGTLERLKAVPDDVPAGHAAQVRALLDSMARNERPLVSGLEARRALEFISSLYKSAATRRPVARGEIVPGDPFYAHVAGTFATGR